MLINHCTFNYCGILIRVLITFHISLTFDFQHSTFSHLTIFPLRIFFDTAIKKESLKSKSKTHIQTAVIEWAQPHRQRDKTKPINHLQQAANLTHIPIKYKKTRSQQSFPIFPQFISFLVLFLKLSKAIGSYTLIPFLSTIERS